MFIPRPSQEEVLRYRSGRMGVSAVPGSGKTHTLSRLAAEVIARGELAEDQEVLIVTLVNSAVDNFSSRISAFIKERNLLPNFGYRVRTLHGLAHDIVRDRPGILQLAEDFQIIDERATGQILEEVSRTWLASNPYTMDSYLEPDLEQGKRDWARREQLPDLVVSMANSFIRYAKDLQITPEILKNRLVDLPVPLPLAEMGCTIYADYQRALAYRGAVDFDDLIRLALQALQMDTGYLETLRYRWPYILEDEAQDSSRLQEEILKLLAGETGNWVRVGDPNQAIYETFTTANPDYLLNFLGDPRVQDKQLPDSGRSTQSIIELANQLIDWTRDQHPLLAARGALTIPYIQPTPPGDPQPNPPDDPMQVHWIGQRLTPQEELRFVAEDIQAWLADHMESTVAVLSPRNQRGFELVAELKRRNIEYKEILGSTSATRAAAGALANVISYLADPSSSSKLSTVYKVWRRAERDNEQARGRISGIAEALNKCNPLEDYLWPRLDADWLEKLEFNGVEGETLDELSQFRQMVRRWQGTVMLPIDQTVLTLAQDLFTEPPDLAIAHKLALILRQSSEVNPGWRLPELTQELAVVARNERRFLGFSEDDTGFDPDQYKGKVVVSTIHKAKGLEWDRVYLMSLNTYDFPSGQGNDRYISEKWFVRERLNLEAEALSQLESAVSKDQYFWYEEGAATSQARVDYIRERLRLLYVGITRARKELVVTYNTGRDGSQLPAAPFLALMSYWEDYINK